MREIWHWFSQLVAGSRSGAERLSVPLDRLHLNTDQLIAIWPDDYRDSNDVLRLLHRDSGETETGGPGPSSAQSTGTLGDTFTRPLPGHSYSGDCTTVKDAS